VRAPERQRGLAAAERTKRTIVVGLAFRARGDVHVDVVEHRGVGRVVIGHDAHGVGNLPREQGLGAVRGQQKNPR
jgi:hypothetical protein